MEACNCKKTFFQDHVWFISCFAAGNLINVNSNFILFLFWNNFVVKEKCRLERKGSFCVGLPSHCWQAASHFSLGVIDITLKNSLLQQNHNKTNRLSERPCLASEKGWTVLHHLNVCTSLKPLSISPAPEAVLSALISQSPHAAGNHSRSPQHLFSC